MPSIQNCDGADRMALLDIRNLSVSFDTRSGPFLAVNGVDLSVDRDDVLAIVGESGSGKSVAMLAVMGLLPWTAPVTADTMLFDGLDLLTISDTQRRTIIRRDIAMIFQEPMTSLNPCFTVGFQIGEVLETHFAGGQDQPRPAMPVLVPVDPIPRSEESREKEQAVLALGFHGTSISSPDRFALELIQEACSDMGSRLFMRIRDELGLAYYVGASLLTGQTPGYFAFYCGTAPEKIELVEKELRAQAEILRTEGLSDEELARAKAKIIGQRKIARQELGGFAMSSALDELYGLGYSHFESETQRFESVTAADIRAAAPDIAEVVFKTGHSRCTAAAGILPYQGL